MKNNFMKRFKILGLLLLFSSMHLMAQQKDRIDTALIHFWKTRMMYNESVLMLSRNGELPASTLLFVPDKIISVKNSALNFTYKKGVDWIYENGQLKLLKGSKAAYLTTEQLYPVADKYPKKDGGFVLYREGSFFHEHQLVVTYKHARNVWEGPVPVFQGGVLPETMKKLKGKKKLKVLLFGDSIAVGCNASAWSNVSPFLPSFGMLVSEALKRFYKADVIFENTAVGGMDSNWGKDNVQKSVVDHDPDLVILAFGMNDGTYKLDPQVFKANTKAMIDKIKMNNPLAEFVLISTTIPNPESTFTGTQVAFKEVLQALTGQGIVMVDMTAVHTTLLKRKPFQDMTGNNINHPNDFLIRWYAQQIAGVLIP